MGLVKKHFKKILGVLGLTIAVAFAAPNDPPVTPPVQNIVMASEDINIKVPLTGTGTTDDSFRPDLPAGVTEWSAHIPTDSNGLPLYPDAFVLIKKGNPITPALESSKLDPQIVEQEKLIRDPALNPTTLSPPSALDWFSIKKAKAASLFINGKVTIAAPLIFTDNFNRADSNPIGGNWTTMPGHDAIQIVSNVAEGTLSGGSDDGAYFSPIPAWPNDQYSQVKVITLNLTTARNATVAVRQSTSVNTRYLFRVRGPLGVGTVAWQTTKVIAGATTTLTSGTTTLASGDTIYLDIIGTTMTAKINGVVLSTTSDTAITAGFPGFEAWSNGGVLADAQVDDWEGGAGGYGKVTIP